MRRLGWASLVVLGIFGVGVIVSQVVSSLDDVDVTDEVVQVVRSNEDDGEDTVVLELARATRWSEVGGPSRRVADRYSAEGNAELESAFDRLYAAWPTDPRSGADDGRPDTSRLDCRYWPVVRKGRPIEDVERLYRACYDTSEGPGALPMSATDLTVVDSGR